MILNIDIDTLFLLANVVFLISNIAMVFGVVKYERALHHTLCESNHSTVESVVLLTQTLEQCLQKNDSEILIE